MDPAFEAYKNKIGERLTRTLADALGQGVLSEEQAVEIAEYVLQNIDAPQNSAQLLDLLTELAHKWAIFGHILTLELGEITGKQDQVAVEKAEELIKQNRIDDALNVVENANPAPGGN